MKLDPEDYLATVLPALLKDAPGAASESRRIIQLVIMDRPDCTFTYVVQGPNVEVERGVADVFDLGIALPAADLSALAENRLDIPRALKTGRLKITGNEELLLWLADRLSRVRY